MRKNHLSPVIRAHNQSMLLPPVIPEIDGIDIIFYSILYESNIEMDIITAVVLGGVSIAGGSG
ncbi:hypothetical protein [Oceanispirochaeta crateris]|uniref:hypothetical protein n=1 Tax=Oceanispirochaeta crateris TaxID=2518645 RepID=UPI00143D195E|nr:hypothetical protein [Oceanispirochaeta crateris]